MMSLIKKKESGFTLLELLITMAIITILAAIAVPSYQAHVRTTQRVEAENLLLELASKQQKFHTENYQYTNDIGLLGFGNLGNNAYPTDSAAYVVSVQLNNSTYTLTAVPTDDQAKDGCGNLSLTSTGLKGRSGEETLANCWK